MKKYKITWPNGKNIIVKANSPLELVKKYDLCNRENVKAIAEECYHEPEDTQYCNCIKNEAVNIGD